jgi:hypothetical protein
MEKQEQKSNTRKARRRQEIRIVLMAGSRILQEVVTEPDDIVTTRAEAERWIAVNGDTTKTYGIVDIITTGQPVIPETKPKFVAK